MTRALHNFDSFPAETMPSLAREWFVLYRNGSIYASRWEREQLVQIVLRNPDFTVRENGEEPKATIVRYTATDATNI